MTFSAAALESAGAPYRGERMRLVLSAAFLSLTLAPAVAADLFGSAPPMTIPASLAPTSVEVGSNWYLRGDVGVGFDDAPSVTLASIPLRTPRPSGGGPGVGRNRCGICGRPRLRLPLQRLFPHGRDLGLLDESVAHAFIRRRLPLRPSGRRKPGHRGCGRISL